MRRHGILALGLLSLLSATRTARADDSSDVDKVQTGDSTSHAIDRTWLYLDDAKLAAPWTPIGMSNVTYTSVGSSPTRVYSPYNSFGANTALPGAMTSVGGEVGIASRVSVIALGQVGFGGEGPSPSAGAIAGVRFQLLPDSRRHAHLVASAGYLREAWAGPVFDDATGTWLPGQPHGDDGAWVQAAFSGDIDRLRLGTTVHAEHVFSPGRDAVDVMVQAGATYRVVGMLRAGVEYIGQDLEETFADAAEGGARHFIGPTASIQLLQDRLTMVAGPSIGLSQFSPSFVGRFGLSYGF